MPGKLRVPEWIVSQTSVRNTRGRNGIDGRWRSCRVRGSSGGGSPTRSPVLQRCHTAPDSDGRGGILAELFRAADKGRRHKTVGHSSARCDLQRLDGLASVSGFTRLRRAGAASSSRREPWHRVRGARAGAGDSWSALPRPFCMCARENGQSTVPQRLCCFRSSTWCCSLGSLGRRLDTGESQKSTSDWSWPPRSRSPLPPRLGCRSHRRFYSYWCGCSRS